MSPQRLARHSAAGLALAFAACGGDGPTGDNTPPTVVSFSPAAGATAIPRTPTISATFSEAVDVSTVTASTFVLMESEGTQIPGTLTVDDRVVSLVPTPQLVYGTTHSVRVSTGVRDLAGNALSSPVEWSFETMDNPPPVVIGTEPAAGARGVDRAARIVATFSEAITAPPTASAFLVSRRGGVSATTAVQDATMTVIPSPPLAMGTEYTVVLQPTIRDLDGATMGTHSWSFTTAVDPAPEHVSSAVAVGAVIEGERLEVAGDVDEFHLSGGAGDEWVVFVQTTRQEWPTVALTVVDSTSGAVVAHTEAPVGFPELEEWSTGRFVVPRAGPYVIRTSGDAETDYRFRVYAVDRAPESSPATVVRGDTVSEAIDGVADVDEFAFAGIAGEEVSIAFQLQAGMADGLAVALLFGGQVVRELSTSTITGALDDFGTGRMTLPSTGAYTLRVTGPARGQSARATGAYRFEVYPIDRRPENRATVSLDGGPIAGAIDRPGDVDEYEVAGTAGQLVVVHIGTTGTRGGELLAELVGATGTRHAITVTGGFFGDAGIGYSRRIALPQTGTYRLRVQGTTPASLAIGSYALETYTVSAAPEHVPATIAVGQTVSAERIDRPGDFDVFTFAGEAGREVNLFLGWAEANSDLYATLSSGIFTRAGTPALDGQSTGRFTLKDSTYTLTVDPHWAAQLHTMHSHGAYAFRVFPIERQPEGRANAYALGDTVSAEPLYPAGDIDDYVFTLAAETTLDIFWDAPFTGPSDAVSGLLYAETTGTIIWGNFSTVNGELVRRITLPAGSYRLSVLNQNVRIFGDQFMTRWPTLGYRFALRPVSP